MLSSLEAFAADQMVWVFCCYATLRGAPENKRNAVQAPLIWLANDVSVKADTHRIHLPSFTDALKRTSLYIFFLFFTCSPTYLFRLMSVNMYSRICQKWDESKIRGTSEATSGSTVKRAAAAEKQINRGQGLPHVVQEETASRAETFNPLFCSLKGCSLLKEHDSFFKYACTWTHTNPCAHARTHTHSRSFTHTLYILNKWIKMFGASPDAGLKAKLSAHSSFLRDLKQT